MAFKTFAETVTLAGVVESTGGDAQSFVIRTRSGDQVVVEIGAETNYEVMTNIDGVSRNRFVQADTTTPGTGVPNIDTLKQCLGNGTLVFLRGVHQEDGDRERFEASTIYLLQSTAGGKYVFEETNWWLVQISQLADRWLDMLFDANRDYTVSDFSKFYRTNLNITGSPDDSDPNTQECATLSRLIYGLSSAYLLTGLERYYLAAKAAVEYQRQAFRSLSSDGIHVFWAHGRRRLESGADKLVFASDSADDKDSIPLYEQIYALAGLAQYYRITADWQVLEDIKGTLNSFDDYFRDPKQGGYFSHLDPITMRPDGPALGQNNARKNWNSIGDHIPAYLVNLVLALDPVPDGTGRAGFAQLSQRLNAMLDELTHLIVTKFPDDKSDYVNERFMADWTPDHGYSWQKNYGIVGHNLKISWNLARCAFNLRFRANQARDRGRPEAEELERKADSCLAVATQLADRMGQVGVDQLRGGVFDMVARQPMNGMPVQFAYGPTKDFWQQEQGILAYLLMYGTTRNEEYLKLARECMIFWNLFFLDRERQGIYFRTREGGLPEIEGMYGQKGSHAMSGYHAFELNYLAHLYIRAFVETTDEDRCFCLHFRVRGNRDQQTINVLPDFAPPGHVAVSRVRANGLEREDLLPDAADDFRIRLDGIEPDPDDGSIGLTVEFRIHD